MRTGALLVVASCAAATADGVRPVLVTRDVYLMGTRAHLATYAATREKGLATLASALDVLEHVDHELSTWRESSDISALNRHPVGSPWPARPSLCRMFGEVWFWQGATAGAFDPAIGRLLAAWDVHGHGALPTAESLARAARVSGLALLSLDRTRCALTKHGDVAIDVGGFGKGEALDRVEAALGDEPWMIDLGGQVSVGGAPPDGWKLAIADPRDRDEPYLQLSLVDGSLSTSGGSERDLAVNGTRVGHILNPRTGRPASFTGSVTVWHRRGLAADALSTALYVMGPEEGLRWADDHRIAALYLIPERGTVRAEPTRMFEMLFTDRGRRDFAPTGHRDAATRR